MRRAFAGLVGLTLAGLPSAFAGDKTIQGVISVRQDLARHLGPDHRLAIKIYHPGDGIELDTKYQILPTFKLPLEFRIGPAIDMSGRTKWSAYVVEVFTDTDGDLLSVGPGELLARTAEPVPLGTVDLGIELNTLRD